MKLEDEVLDARKTIYRDGYDMSLGEIASLYEREELIIYPEYQRLFRWDITKKSRFIESLLLNIPIPPIFVFSDAQGRWELVDGLQRLSTVFEFMGILKDADGNIVERFVCDGTALLPDLLNKSWPLRGESPSSDTLAPALQVSIRRARIRVEILNQESDQNTKYELFQRLNTGGVALSEQEVRNCVIVAINRDAFRNIEEMAADESFKKLASVGKNAIERQFLPELVVRFLVMRHVPYTNGMDVHEYLDKGIIAICSDKHFKWDRERFSFAQAMERILTAAGDKAFKKNNRFSLAYYEFISLGLSKALDHNKDVSDDWIVKKIKSINNLSQASKYTGMGVRGTQRLSRFVFAKAESHFSK